MRIEAECRAAAAVQQMPASSGGWQQGSTSAGMPEPTAEVADERAGLSQQSDVPTDYRHGSRYASQASEVVTTLVTSVLSFLVTCTSLDTLLLIRKREFAWPWKAAGVVPYIITGKGSGKMYALVATSPKEGFTLLGMLLILRSLNYGRHFCSPF